MWSAPHQPFVLPVRIRSFEDMYQQHVNADPAAVRVSGTRAQAVTQAVSTGTDRLKQGLIAELNAPGTKFISIPNALPDGGKALGFISL
jgi:hypothetical protein